MPKQAKSSTAKVRQICQEYPNEFSAIPACDLRCNLCGVLVKCDKKFFVESHRKSKQHQRKLETKSKSQSKQTFLQLDQVNFKEQVAFFSKIYFSKVSILPSFEISITGLKTVWRLQPPVPVLLPLCRQTYLSVALVHNLYLLVQLLLQDCLDTIAQWFSTRVPRNPRAPLVPSRGSARSYTNCIIQLNYCIGVSRAHGILH